MPTIWCAISSHGLGHAAQVVPVLNELGRIVPDLRATLRTQVPAWFFKDRLTIPWTLSPGQQDVGCIQHGPLSIDVAATWDAHARFHQEWERKVQDETQAMLATGPTLVLSDISHLAIEAGARAGFPAIGLCNLSWDLILDPLADPKQPGHGQIVAHIRRAYAHAELMLRPAPGIPMTAFRRIVDIGPIADRPPEPVPEIREILAAAPDDRIVLIGFGGIALDTLPFAQLDRLDGYRFLVAGTVPDGCARIRAASTLPFSFRALLASADVLVTKPGYSTVIEAVALQKPVVYVRRYNFADEQALVDYLHRHGRAIEFPRSDFEADRWSDALAAVRDSPAPPEPPPAPSGAHEAARAIAASFL